MSYKFHGHKDFLAAGSEAKRGAAASQTVFTINDATHDASFTSRSIKGRKERSNAMVYYAILRYIPSGAKAEKFPPSPLRSLECRKLLESYLF